MNYFTIIYTILAIAIIGCDAKNPSPPPIPPPIDQSPVARDIERAHAKSTLRDFANIQFDFEKKFGNNPAATSRITASTDGGSIRIDGPGDRVVVWHADTFYSTGDSSQLARDRFDIFTWQYFLMLPYKMSDQGVNIQKQASVQMAGTTYPTALMTFDPGTGDAPDDWYRLHLDPSTGLLRHVGYIVTAGGTSAAEAKANAHSITYNKYSSKGGVPISMQWTFSNYDADTYQVEDSIGYARLTNVKFPDIDQVDYQID